MSQSTSFNNSLGGGDPRLAADVLLLGLRPDRTERDPLDAARGVTIAVLLGLFAWSAVAVLAWPWL